MTYTIYNSSTGEIIAVVSHSDPDQLAAMIGTDACFPGAFEGDKFYFENGAPVAKPEDPSRNATKFNFDYATKSWVLNLEQTANNMRLKRDGFLKATVDRVNPIWYSELTSEQQTQLATYRQLLLDVPAQTDFPSRINWPTKPTWL